MNRNLLKFSFSRKNTPDWPCPTCNKGVLRIIKDSFIQQEPRRIREARFDESWESEWSEYVYSCLLICTNDKCKEVVASSGTGSVGQVPIEDGDGEWVLEHEDVFLPKYFEPHLNLIHIPQNCPKSVSGPLNESFKLFFTSPNAAANNVRIAIEELLTKLKIKRKNERGFIPLHYRIKLLPEKYNRFKDMLTAIKWLGNAGSHGHSEVTMNDVMDAYELTEHILEEIYEHKIKKLESLAKRVNKKKGPSK